MIGPSGVPTGPPGPRRDPTDPRLTAGGPQLLLASAVAIVEPPDDKLGEKQCIAQGDICRGGDHETVILILL